MGITHVKRLLPMTNSLATLALVCLLAGSAVAQQKPAKSTTSKKSSGSKAGTISPTDAVRSSPSAADTHDGTNGVSTGTGGGGTGLTNDQSQAAANPTNNGPTKVDANSSVKTGASSVKGKKRYPKSDS
ncbi:hypothetical protein SAMN05216167_12427 [Spirosoma endophyticum]|uniref:Uncharacterized protein n=2 Tax=Spirosoma endophyticum TaxID=662367 RepID=A0A1I2F1P6_9BACT|nr:hypothetical protein SAMN05216167_12427 [Spirosoma endophyticum]